MPQDLEHSFPLELEELCAELCAVAPLKLLGSELLPQPPFTWMVSLTDPLLLLLSHFSHVRLCVTP